MTESVSAYIARTFAGLMADNLHESMPRTDEIADIGPEWKCGQFGKPGHDYATCPACLDNYNRHLAKHRRRA